MMAALELRAQARFALDLDEPDLVDACQVDHQLADGSWQPDADAPALALRLVHRATGVRVCVDSRRDRAATLLVAIVLLRNALYDLTRRPSAPARPGARRAPPTSSRRQRKR